METLDPGRPLTLREAADMLRVTPNTVRRWIKGGQLPAYRVGPGGGFRIKPDELRRLMERHS